MSIGAGIFLMVVGGILAFAVQDSWDAVNLTVVGYILMLAGLAGGFVLILAVEANSTNALATDGCHVGGD